MTNAVRKSIAALALAAVMMADAAGAAQAETKIRFSLDWIPGSVHAPYPALAANIAPGGLLRALGGAKRLLFYCAFGERSAMAVQAAQDARLGTACHLQGGIDAWKKAGGPLVL